MHISPISKTVIRMSFALLVGAAIGWYAGIKRMGMKTKGDTESGAAREERNQMIAAMDAMFAIHIIESGAKQEAVEYFARPIGSYYRMYGSKAGSNADRARLRAHIEKLASSNSIVAAEIQKKAQ